MIPPPIPSSVVAPVFHPSQQTKVAARWLYWIAGLTLVNSVMILCGSESSFGCGLGSTLFCDAVVVGMGKAAASQGDVHSSVLTVFQVIAVCLDLFAVSLFAALGYFSIKGQRWAWITGIALFGIDTVAVLFLQSWIGVIIHGLAIFSLVTGFRRLNAERRAFESVVITPEPEPDGGLLGES